MSGAVNGMDIYKDGTKFVTGGDEKVNFPLKFFFNMRRRLIL